ncbi:hypothetical protein GF1_20970 [Desulfolithobacter dissulfuricans]|uniref:Lipoprotein n=1 Tax=Desulfolithobacter dissulfuricans TaxID=2795293 RepID=A0A915U1K1_9BACT|nr:hypothetical protein [Desulfolithobacter dissulfuricans]BCO09721.1 hypothetical protein GF1_20970 [Desulfolithobacter dissulfuricans]
MEFIKTIFANPVLLLALFLLAGCAGSESWQKPGGTQASFSLDSRECRLIGEKIAQLHSETGKSVDPVYTARAYEECMRAKGWRRQLQAGEPAWPDVAAQAGSGSLPALAQVHEGHILLGFGQRIVVPPGFRMLPAQKMRVGPTVMEQFFWQNDAGTVIVLIFQENNQTSFEQIGYPVNPPYSLYTSGSGAGGLLQWAAFWGQIKDDWVMGLGAYYHVSDSRRVITVITSPLGPPESTPPPNVTLSREQYHQIDAFADQWQSWLEKQFPHGPGMVSRLKKIITPSVK